MRDIRSALVVGAGAIGAAVASRIYGVDPAAVAICAEGERRERYRRDGFVVNGEAYDFRIAEPGADAPAELIIVAVKDYALDEAIEAMRPFVGPDTTIVSLLNGVSSERRLREAFGEERVPLAFIIGIDALRIGNRIDFSSPGVVRLGFEKGASADRRARVQAVSRFLAAHDVPHELPEDMEKALWFKFMFNVAMNQWSAVLRGSYGLFQRSAPARELLAATMREVLALSDALGKGLAPSDIDAIFATLDGLNGAGRTSMLQDVDARRRTEVDAFAGTVLRLAEETGVAAPMNRALFLALKAIEDAASF
ncbi:2-dehydropantoate 2-reductase [bacterium]|nr:2-dehydropantoate 2-reductase [bacterium]